MIHQIASIIFIIAAIYQIMVEAVGLPFTWILFKVRQIKNFLNLEGSEKI